MTTCYFGRLRNEGSESPRGAQHGLQRASMAGDFSAAVKALWAMTAAEACRKTAGAHR